MTKEFNPNDWYWMVGDDTARVFSSKIGDYVAVDDSRFVGWSSDETKPTRIDSEENLGGLLALYEVRPTQAAVLNGYKNRQLDDVTEKVVFKILFNHENRIRALEGKPTITKAQFVNGVKALI